MLDLKLLRGHQTDDSEITLGEPVCRFVNVQLCGGATQSLKGTVLLENPYGTPVITLDQLKRQVLCSIHDLTYKNIPTFSLITPGIHTRNALN